MNSPIPKASQLLWSAKTHLSHLPGAYAAYRMVTKQLGEGRIYKIHWGPMKGFKWRRDNRLPYWYHLGLWEPEVSRLIESHLRPGAVFWDVGANAGYHTLFARRVVTRSGAVLAFEPNPDMLEVLKGQLALNRYDDVTVLSKAASDQVGELSFAKPENPLMGGIDTYVEGEKITVETTTLDELIKQYPAPDLIKIDVEGAEVEVLMGAQELLSSPHAPHLLLSLHGEVQRTKCQEILSDHGFEMTSHKSFEQMLVAHKPVAKAC